MARHKRLLRHRNRHGVFLAAQRPDRAREQPPRVGVGRPFRPDPNRRNRWCRGHGFSQKPRRGAGQTQVDERPNSRDQFTRR